MDSVVGSATGNWLALQLIGVGYLALLVAQLRYLKFNFNLRFPFTKVQAIFIITSLALSAFAGLAMVLMHSSSAALLMFCSGVSLCLMLLDPVVAVSTLIAQLLIRPWEAVQNGDNFLLSVRLFAAAVLFVWVFHSIARKWFSFRWNRICTLVVCLFLWLFAAAIASQQPLQAVSYLVERFLPILVLTLMITNCISTERDVTLLRSTIVYCAVAVLSGALATTLLDPEFFNPTASDSMHRLHGYGLMGNANDLAALSVVVVPFLVFGVMRATTIRRVFTALALLLVLVALAVSQSRGGMLSLMVAALTFFFCAIRSSRKYLIASTTIVVVPILLFSVISRSEGELSASSSARLNYIVAGVKMAKSSPLFGVGPSNYSEYYERYSGDFSEWGKRTAHSSWVLALSEGGVPALLILASLYIIALKSAFAVRWARPEYLLSLVSYAIAISFLSHTYLFLPYLLTAVVAVGTRVIAPEIRVVQRVNTVQMRAAGATIAILVWCCPVFANASSPEVSGVAGSDKPLGGFKPQLSSLIELDGSRGEVLNFQLRLRSGECKTLRLTPFLGSAANTVALKVKLFKMERIRTEHPSFSGAFVGDIFDPLIPIKFGRFCAPGERWVFGELSIPDDLAAGRYSAKLYFGDSNVDISLKVWRMRIPAQPALPAYTEFSTWYNLLGHYGKWRDQEGVLAKQYLSIIRKHRFDTLTTHILRPEVIEHQGKFTLDIRNVPSSEQSFYQINIRNRPDWAYLGFPTVNPEDIQKASTVKYLKAIEGTIRENVALKRHPASRSMVYLWDEPPIEELPRLMQLASLVKRDAPSLKVMVTTPYRSELRSLVDIFVPVMDQFGGDFPDFSTYQQLQKEGKEIWWYVSCMSHGCDALSDSGIPDMVLDRPAVSIRAIAWLSMRNKIDAFLYYFVNYAYQFYPDRDPWRTLWDFSGNGDGTLLYPGRPGEHGLKKHQPIPSIRLKIWREASFDAEYIRWMEQLKEKPSWWNDEFTRLVPGTRSWDRSYDHYKTLRSRIGEYLDQSEGARHE